MIKLSDRTTETCIGLKVKGKLQASDYDQLEPILENAFKAHGSINMVLEIEEFEGYKDLDAILADVNMAAEKFGDVNKVAVVSNSDWQKVATKLLDPLALTTEFEYFDSDQRDEAWTAVCGTSWKN